MSGYGAFGHARFVPEGPGDAGRGDFVRDRARILHSAGLRRLAAKTQVLQPDADDFVRNRLTHSLEVAQIGREFGASLGCDPDVVDAACLAHDLGHPPFGHSGEQALDAVCAGIGGFEGNAQTFRLVTRLEAKRTTPDGRSAGLNLTRATLDAISKYPWERESPWDATKYGCYAEDVEVFAWVREGATPGRRCLEAQVMDWSDDVAYSVHDVEDGINAGLIDLAVLHGGDDPAGLAAVARRLYAPRLSIDQLVAGLDAVSRSGAVPRRHTGSRADAAALKAMTSRLVGRFVGEVVQATRAAHGDGALTRFAADLVVPDEILAECVMLKAVAARDMMFTDDRRAVIDRQQDLIRTLAAGFGAHPERMDPMFRDDHAAAPDDAARLRVVADQVASLTDNRAESLAREWS